MRGARQWSRAAIAVVLSIARAAAAQEAPEPAGQEATQEELLAKGVRLRKEGQDAEALAVFERAYAQSPSPRALGQLALAQQALARWREAERGLIEALRDAKDDWIARNRVYLEKSLATAQGHLAWLEVQSNLAGVEVWIDGQPAGRSPMVGPVRIVAGEATVDVHAVGYALVRRTLNVDAGARVLTEFTFASQPAPILSPAERSAVVPIAAERPPTSRAVGWAALAGAGGLALVGIAGVVTREVEARVYDSSQCTPLGMQRRSRLCATNRDIGSAAQTVAVVAFAGSGVAAAVAGVLLLGKGSDVQMPSTRGVSCAWTGVGVTCGGAFF
jgi:hypothetical protein